MEGILGSIENLFKQKLAGLTSEPKKITTNKVPELFRQDEADLNKWNVYFAPKYTFDYEWMVTGPYTLNLFKVINVADIPTVLKYGVLPVTALDEKGIKPKIFWKDAGGNETFWTIGKVDRFYGGASGKVLLQASPDLLKHDGAQYRKGDPHNYAFSDKALERFSAQDLTTEKLPPDYWTSWYRAYEAILPFSVDTEQIKIIPLDNTAKESLDKTGVRYELHREKFPVTHHWGACACGNSDSPFGFHQNNGYCG